MASATGKLGDAADFERSNNEWLSVADDPDLSPTDQSFSVAAWVQLESAGDGFRHLIDHKDASDNGLACYINNTPALALHVQGSGGGTNLAHGTTLTADGTTWYFVVWYYDHAGQELGISLNGGAFVTTAHTGGISNTTTDFVLGKWGGGASGYHDGRLDSVSFWLGRVLTDADVDELYNAGDGLDIDDWDAGGGTAVPVFRRHYQLMQTR